MKEISLACGRVTFVSDVDHDWLREHKWRANEQNASGKPYVCATINGKTIYMHRAITKCPIVYKADHRDRNTLNNQRPNLRIASHYQNNLNRGGWALSGIKGVDLCNGSWRARITIQGNTMTLGRFPTKELAGKAYDAKAVELFGEFAALNFPEDYHFPNPDFEEIQIPF